MKIHDPLFLRTCQRRKIHEIKDTQKYGLYCIHKVPMISLAITLYGQCFWLYVVEQQVISDISMIRSEV